MRFALAATGLAETGYWKGVPVLADVNGDGNLDLAAALRQGKGAHVWLGDGRGNWTDSSEGLAMKSSCGGGVSIGDVNGDGMPDLVLADHCQGVLVYLGDGQGRWTRIAGPLVPAAAIPPADNPEAGQEQALWWRGGCRTG